MSGSGSLWSESSTAPPPPPLQRDWALLASLLDEGWLLLAECTLRLVNHSIYFGRIHAYCKVLGCMHVYFRSSAQSHNGNYQNSSEFNLLRLSKEALWLVGEGMQNWTEHCESRLVLMISGHCLLVLEWEACFHMFVCLFSPCLCVSDRKDDRMKVFWWLACSAKSYCWRESLVGFDLHHTKLISMDHQ